MSLLPILVALALLSSPAATLPASQPRSIAALGPDEPRFADVQLATGVRLRYAELGDPGVPPMILLHGYTDSWFSYSRVLPTLAARHHVFALDQRGHGDSDRPAHGYACATSPPTWCRVHGRARHPSSGRRRGTRWAAWWRSTSCARRPSA
jgi:pimeloyl-ACP methyl ester carboxylesterase